ncbi:baseplate J/gp47 family protein [Komagataeibacter xylinus]|uniref:Baseplate J/gp47 family protein n=1 Tax=Komagataeibacter xylinus TaxID=28448 RepID=A0A857FTJ4_KOMXY|nr:baseplate J/gp47 family protein [Komagataeibacter xylinus]QHC36467.1 baseplate J/gp47 family protein [Komagataeibacter xylinus]
MPYQQPTLSDLQAQGLNDIVATNITQGRALFPRSVLRALTWCFANLTWGNYDFLASCYRQAVPFTATDEALDGWGAMREILRKDATAATGTVQFTGATPQKPLPMGTVIMRADGLDYITTADAAADATGTLSAPVTCQTTGATGNCDAGIAFSLLTAISGLPAQGVALAAFTGGADMETDSEYRTRVLAAYASRAGGGRQDDYVEWAEDVAGVTRAWCNPNGFGPGTVVVYFMMDDAEAANGGYPQGTDGGAADETRYAPATGDQLTVADAIYPQRPATALVIACAPTPCPIDVTVRNLSPNTTAQITAMETALADLFYREGTPLGMTLAQSDIEDALLSTGASFTMVSPAGPTDIPVGSLPSVGAVVPA